MRHSIVVAVLLVAFGIPALAQEEPQSSSHAGICTWTANEEDGERAHFELGYKGYTGEIRVQQDISDGSGTYQWLVIRPSDDWVVGGATGSPEQTVAELCFEMIKTHASDNDEPTPTENYSQDAAIKAMLAVLQQGG